MSYNISLFRVRGATGDDEPDATPGDMEILASLIQAQCPGFHRTPSAGAGISLTEDAAQVDVHIGNKSVDISLPLLKRATPLSLTRIRDCVEVLSPLGYAAFDRQLDRVVTVADLQALHDVAASLPALLAQMEKRGVGKPVIAPPPLKPWWRFWVRR
ncbi:MAG: hypothetical protein HY820_12535 [Acidobacteria bacterium]|nr:hypothetical protein [Acidobacteriota bacterium]